MLNFRLWYIFVIFFIGCGLSFVKQQSSDSTKIANLIKTHNGALYQDSAKAINAINHAITLAKQSKETKFLLQALNTRTKFNLMKSRQQAAKDDIEQALSLKSILGKNAGFASTYTNLGLYYFYNADYKKSVTAHITAINIAEEFNHKFSAARNYNNIGNVYIKIEDYQKALNYYNKAYAIAKNENLKSGMAHVLGNLGIVYTNLGKPDSAIYAISQSLKIHKAQNNTIQMALNYSNLGGLFWDMGQYDSAKHYFERYRALSKSGDNLHGQISALLSLTELALQSQDLVQAEQYLIGLDSAIFTTDNMEFRCKLYELKSLLLEKTGKFNKALEARKVYEQWKDSIAGKDLKAEIENLELKYQTAQKEKELIYQKTQLETKNTQLILAISIGVFILISAGMSFFLYKQKRENRYQMESILAITEAQEKERQRLARDLHDSVGAMLANLKNKLSVNGVNKDEIDLITRVNQEVRQISHDMMPGSLKKFGLAAAIKSELELTELYTGLKTSFSEFGLKEGLTKDLEVHIYRIIQEAIQNTIKHARATSINVSLIQNNRFLNLIIEDNGIGFRPNKSSEGLGIKNIKTRIKLMNGKLVIDSHPQSGTILNINIPVHEYSVS